MIDPTLKLSNESNPLKVPLLLAPDNFTPKTRTPWAGDFIAKSIKWDLLPDSRSLSIGESWEFSCDPEYGSQVLAPKEYAGMSLRELVKQLPNEILSKEVAAKVEQGAHTCEILVKLVNSASNLSLQVHPEDQDPHLKPHECGKPESWLVLHAEPGAGIYLGFSKKLSKTELRKELSSGKDCSDLLNFVPVKPGDYFEIDPGVPHSIGAGTTILEPQRIIDGKSGKTYRLWDWGRLYDQNGNLDLENGNPRELHLEEGLRIIDPEQQIGDRFVNSLKKSPIVREITTGVNLSSFPMNRYYQLHIMDIERNCNLEIEIKNGYGAFICLNGQGKFHAPLKEEEMKFLQGNSALLPNQIMPAHISVFQGSKYAIVVPVGSEFYVN